MLPPGGLFRRRSGSGSCSSRSSLIERASFYLNDRTTGFAAGADRHAGVLRARQHAGRGGSSRRRERAVASCWRWLLVAAWCALLLAGLQAFLLATLAAGRRPRGPAGAGAAGAGLGLALGLPFPLGLSRMGQRRLPALGLGAERRLLVVATPLANLLLRSRPATTGFCWGALLLYVTVARSVSAQ